jgi:phosphoglycolate phosphatase-like HAD superfamily hydrolase
MQAIIFDLDDTIFAKDDELRDGVADLLAILRRLGLRLAAVTEGDHRMLVRLDEAGIRRHFDVVVTTAHVEVPKSIDGIRHVLAELRTEPHHAALVSHAHTDILLGKDASLHKTIRVAHGQASVNIGHLVEADHVVKDIPSVLDVLE